MKPGLQAGASGPTRSPWTDPLLASRVRRRGFRPRTRQLLRRVVGALVAQVDGFHLEGQVRT